MTDTKSVLTVENLAVMFHTPMGAVQALHDVSFNLNQGEILGIVGESGSGKTVACRAIMGILPPNARITSGSIRYGEQNLLELPQADVRRIRGSEITMIFQNPSSHLDPLMCVGHQIGEGVQYHFGASAPEAHAKAVEFLDRVRIANPHQRAHAYPHQLSGGMKQRVMIAAALACEPKILIADEPTTALDVTVQAGILDLIQTLRAEQRLSVILISHDLGVIGQVCDRIIVMRDGRVVESGTTREVLLHPRAQYTQVLIASNPSLHFDQLPDALPESPAAPNPLIEVNHVSVQFGQERLWHRFVPAFQPSIVRAVDDVSFTLEPGTKLGIVGESGSGKSTIARVIAKLVTPINGNVRYRGQSILGLSGEELIAYRRAVQMVFQDPFSSLNPRMSLEDTLREPLVRHNLVERTRVDERVAELMHAVELSPQLRTRRPHELSGGQCQRVALARALTMNPQVLIADEITSALDVTIQAQILDLLRKLHEEHDLAIIFISHDLGVVRALCDEVLVMQHGRVVEYGGMPSVLFRPQQAYTQQLLAAVPRLPFAGQTSAPASPS